MKVYGIAEIAEALGLTRNTVAQWHRRGRLPNADQELAMGPIWFAPTVHRWLRDETLGAQPSAPPDVTGHARALPGDATTGR